MLNKEELAIGAVLGLGFFWAIGWWCITLALATSILWAMGGAGIWGTKAWRRVGVPVAIAITQFHLQYTTMNILIGFIAMFATVGILSIGYGSRSLQPPDPGSPLGNFWQDHLGINDEDLAKWLSRATIILAVWLVWLLTLYLIH